MKKKNQKLYVRIRHGKRRSNESEGGTRQVMWEARERVMEEDLVYKINA